METHGGYLEDFDIVIRVFDSSRERIIIHKSSLVFLWPGKTRGYQPREKRLRASKKRVAKEWILQSVSKIKFLIRSITYCCEGSFK